jgi:four helix bundle protein
MRDFRRLDVWNRAHQLTLSIFNATGSFPSSERFGLVAQMRRSAVSIPSNIAEGAGRSSRRDYARFLDIAVGSAHELDYQLQLSRDLGYTDPDRYDELADELIEVRSMAAGLRASVLADRGTG